MVATLAPSLISDTAMCSAVVDLPEPPFSLPITSTCARPGSRTDCACTTLGFTAGWKLVMLSPHNAIDRCGKNAGESLWITLFARGPSWALAPPFHPRFLREREKPLPIIGAGTRGAYPAGQLDAASKELAMPPVESRSALRPPSSRSAVFDRFFRFWRMRSKTA